MGEIICKSMREFQVLEDFSGTLSWKKKKKKKIIEYLLQMYVSYKES